MQEAHRPLLSKGENVATVATKVVYTSPSQFSREYRRTFSRCALRIRWLIERLLS